MKPVYEIENAFVMDSRLWGNIRDHPSCTNGHLQMTSLIVDTCNNRIETENSVYHILSWAPDEFGNN